MGYCRCPISGRDQPFLDEFEHIADEDSLKLLARPVPDYITTHKFSPSMKEHNNSACFPDNMPSGFVIPQEHCSHFTTDCPPPDLDYLRVKLQVCHKLMCAKNIRQAKRAVNRLVDAYDLIDYDIVFEAAKARPVEFESKDCSSNPPFPCILCPLEMNVGYNDEESLKSHYFKHLGLDKRCLQCHTRLEYVTETRKL